MTCPPDIAEVLLEILTYGILKIRGYAGAGWSDKCFVESDHLHNLPALVSNYRPELLRYYWDVERPSYSRQVPTSGFEPMWEKLGPLLVSHNIPPLP